MANLPLIFRNDQRPFVIQKDPLTPQTMFIFFTQPTAFVSLPFQPTTDVLQFGIHHEMALTACQILACNSPGYLSTSRDRNAGRVNAALDSIIPSNKYYLL